MRLPALLQGDATFTPNIHLTMQIEQPSPKDILWSKNFIAAACANFLMFLAFYMLLPILPIYLTDQFDANKSIVGIILASYTINRYTYSPFAGFMVDSFPRKPLLMICYAAFILFFGGYLLAGTLLIFAFIRAAHGLAFGLVTISNSTVAIDTMPSSRRGEGIGYYGVSSNLAMAFGPTIALFLLDLSHNYDTVFIVSLVAGCIGFGCVNLIKLPARKIDNGPKEPISLDRFILLKGIPGMLPMSLISFSYGILSSYLAIYGKEEVGLASGTGLYFVLMSVGLISSRITAGRMLNKGLIIPLILTGLYILATAFCLFIFVKNAFGFYTSALLMGIAYGCICPSFQTMFINLAHHNQRGTANSTFFTSWDFGIGAGVLIGGAIADISNYTTAYLFGLTLIAVGYTFFRLITAPYFNKNKLR